MCLARRGRSDRVFPVEPFDETGLPANLELRHRLSGQRNCNSTAPPVPTLRSTFSPVAGRWARLMRAHDWADVATGTARRAGRSRCAPPSAHAQHRPSDVHLVGPRRRCLYNDAYRRSIGPERHPGSLGRPAREVWDEIWDIIGPQIEQVMSGRGATWHETSWCRSPATAGARTSTGPTATARSTMRLRATAVGGVLVVCTETTQQVLAARQLPRADGWRSCSSRRRFMALLRRARAPHRDRQSRATCSSSEIGRTRQDGRRGAAGSGGAGLRRAARQVFRERQAL